MWIFSKTGFFSVVVDSQREGFMLVRARCRRDVWNLYDKHAATLSSIEPPKSSETRDYRWRLSIAKQDWIQLAARLAAQIDYSNFKSEVTKQPSQANKSEAYHHVWQELWNVQRDETDGKPGKGATVPNENSSSFSHGPSESDQWEAWIKKLDKQRDVPNENTPPKRKERKRGRKLF